MARGYFLDLIGEVGEVVIKGLDLIEAVRGVVIVVGCFLLIRVVLIIAIKVNCFQCLIGAAKVVVIELYQCLIGAVKAVVIGLYQCLIGAVKAVVIE